MNSSGDSEHDLDIRAVDRTSTRVIYFRTKRGEMHLPLSEAKEVHRQLTLALERAGDPTPIPEPARIYSGPLPKKVSVVTTVTLADLGLTI